MSEFQDIDFDRVFQDLTTRLEDELSTIPDPSGLPIAARDGERIALDLLEGEGGPRRLARSLCRG